MGSKKLTWLKVFALAALCISMAVGGSFAWTMMNRIVSQTGMAFQIDGESMSISTYRAYRYNPETLEYENITDQAPNYHLAPFDSIFRERNVNTPLLFAVTVSGYPEGTNQIDISFYTNRPLMENPQGEEDPSTGKVVNRYTSAIVRMKAAAGSYIFAGDATDYESNPLLYPQLYSKATDYIFKGANSSNTAKFVNITKSGLKSTYVADSNGEYRTPTAVCHVPIDPTIKARNDDDELYTVVYFLIDYDEELIETQDITNFNTFKLQLGAAIEFENDIPLITFTAHTK